MSFREVNNCRSCGANLDGPERFSLGTMAVVSFPESPDEQHISAPLVLVECSRCTLVQLRHSVDPAVLFKHFWYRSGVTHSMREALKDVAESAMESVELKDGDGVLDIGTNDGTLLEFFPSNTFRAGFEPAENISWRAREKGFTTITDFFSEAKLPSDWHHRFKVITAISMFYDVEELGPFMEAVKLALDPEGVFIVQMNYLGWMLRNLAVDNICHEHLTYFSARAFSFLMNRHGLTISRMQFNQVNGGSIRFFVSRSELQPEAVNSFLQTETQNWDRFDRGFEYTARLIREFFSDRKDSSLCGASTRGLSTLQWLGLGKETFSVIGDRDPYKHGRYYGDTGIPIVSEEEARSKRKIMMVLPWHFESEIVTREKRFIESGGELLFPLPRPKIVRADGERYL